ncbi:hypothetical protein PHMEG_00031259 [Phytophthora megakarya]|uniref:Uncharacterized protein n=1 Tax=Phytophthora megakarya TaxID=4795 RepID=A0A225V0V4_9STRA|nr:hypothetical protein PHMEG_00031259 [Phytophthora megakarya]
MHLLPVNELQLRAWLKTSKVNMQKFSAAVDLPEASAPSSPNDVRRALGALQSYMLAFGSTDAIDLVNTIYRLVDGLFQRMDLDVSDLSLLVYWIDTDVLEKYRNHAQLDVQRGGTSRLEVVKTVKPTDASFLYVMQLIQAARPRPSNFTTSVVSYSQQPSKAQKVSAALGPSARREITAAPDRIPPHIAKLIPKRGRKGLCLMSLTVSGCPGSLDDPSECSFSRRAHFIPAKIPEVVLKYTADNIGKLRDDIKRD